MKTTRERVVQPGAITPGLLLALLALAALVFFLLQIGTVVRVSSMGMVPTLMSGDYVYAYAGAGRDPERGEVVAIRLAVEGKRRFPPDRRPELPTGSFVGRIIGIPGDVVESRSNVLRLNREGGGCDSRGST
jgi:signal peptidase I